MSIPLSLLLKSSVAQSFRALTTILTKAKETAAESGADESAYLDARLYPDMHPMKWQVQMITEFAQRGCARLLGAKDEDLPDIAYDQESFDALLSRVAEAAADVEAADDAELDAAADRTVSLPIGPDQTMDLDGSSYVINAFLPNLHFHVAIAHGLLRSQGVAIGKRDYMGM